MLFLKKCILAVKKKEKSKRRKLLPAIFSVVGQSIKNYLISAFLGFSEYFFCNSHSTDSRAMKLCKGSLHSNNSCLLSLIKEKILHSKVTINSHSMLFTWAKHRDFSGNSPVFNVGLTLIPLFHRQY